MYNKTRTWRGWVSLKDHLVEEDSVTGANLLGFFRYTPPPVSMTQAHNSRPT
jgi:hypothetical protein